MEESRESPLFFAPGDDPEMQRAFEEARSTFRYFWREVAWERRRIIPALDLACVKAPFADGGDAGPAGASPEVEHMWLSEIDFDGRHVAGVLLNEPNALESIRRGDPAQIPLGSISDWMYAIGGEVFGAYTVNLLRSRMDRKERRDHDAAWGLKFGDPATIRVVPEPNRGGGLLKSWFAKGREDSGEHPMSEAMATSLRKELAANPGLLTETDDRGWTILHQEALAGSYPTVKVMLEAGADPDIRTLDGRTPRDLAASLGWEKVVALLGAK